ncbi:MAG: penicillin-binding transpeptidase domain-containing protein [Waddliaceae bacterium]
MPRQQRSLNAKLSILKKANSVVRVVFMGLVVIGLRVWHLALIQHDDRLEESRKPQRRLVIEPAKRGTIRDRFNLPLAINKVQYNAGILYSQIRQIPSSSWEYEDGKRVKRKKRLEYIAALSQLLADELNLDPERVEDLIHSKASFYNHLPFVIKEDISESAYYRLKMLEKDWLGIHVQRLPKREYPLGKAAGDVIGYLGAISREEYEAVIHEIKTLETFIDNQEKGTEPQVQEEILSLEGAKQRLRDLIEHAYSIHDYVGKTGIEGKFEKSLRGYHGKKSYYSDARGNFLRELPGSKSSLSGKRVLLTLSSELQQFAEKLLIQNESTRPLRVKERKERQDPNVSPREPWIRGGAIIAMDPNNGDLLTLASYPRFDPNDFIATGNPEFSKKKNANIRKWFETERYLGEIWDMIRPLDRERFDDRKKIIVEEQLPLTWENYLSFLLPHDSSVLEGLEHLHTIEHAVRLQRHVDRLLTLTNQTQLAPLLNVLYQGENHQPCGRRLPPAQQTELENCLRDDAELVNKSRRHLDVYLSNLSYHYDKMLLIDLCRLVVKEECFSEELLQAVGNRTLSTHRCASAALVTVEEHARQLCQDLFHEYHFKPWKKDNQKTFIQGKRAEEKAAGKRYAKPYLDLLDQKEKEWFALFWEEHRWKFMTAFLTGKFDDVRKELLPYFKDFNTWEREISQGAHQALCWREAYGIVKNALKDLPERFSIAYLQSLRSFEDLTRPLLGRYRHIGKEKGKQLEKHLAMGFYPLYGFGYGRSFAYRQAAPQGSIFKLVTAYEALIQRYQKLEGRQHTISQLNPLEIIDNTQKRGSQTYLGYDAGGNPIPQRYKGGRIPRSHRSGIGKIDLLQAFEFSSNPYFSLLAGDHLQHPNDLAKAARKFCFGERTEVALPAEIAGRVPEDLEYNRNGLYALAIGQHSLVVTPLQTAVMLSALVNGGKILIPHIVKFLIGKPSGFRQEDGEAELQHLVQAFPTEVKQTIFMPGIVQRILVEGMSRAIRRNQSHNIASLSRIYRNYPEAISDFLELKDQLIGKSSTAESMESITIEGANLYNHIWFGGILYDNAGTSNSTFTVVSDSLGRPELVVVVYFRYGAWGKDTAPVAAQVAKKWREIKNKHYLGG